MYSQCNEFNQISDKDNVIDESQNILNCANKLEGILRKYLHCGYNDFGVKANDNLIEYDWKSPINFALGYCYAQSNKDPKVKINIDFFLGNTLIGKNIKDVLDNYEYYNFETKQIAFEHVNKIIDQLSELLMLDEISKSEF